jgi:hypothetical protein
MSEWGPLLLAIEFNSLPIVKYFLEEVNLNPSIFLMKPRSFEEKKINA